ncbi:MAG: hypothetical protein H5T86_06850 [Armatimonadetes bacterium]|nr:hypothetical protein [Armatimonadota bacterium]
MQHDQNHGVIEPRQRKEHARAGVLVGFLMMAGSGYFELATGLLRWIFVLRLLGPTGRGLVGIVQVAEQYLSNIHLGGLHGITKRLPQALGTRDEIRAQQIEDVGATWVLVTAVVGAIGMASAGLLWPGVGPLTRIIVCLGASIYLCDQTYNLYRTIGRAWQVYLPLVAGSVVLSLGLTAFMIGGAAIGKALGATAGWLLASAAAVLTLHWTMQLRVRFRLDKSILRDLILTGIPLAAMAFGDALLVNLEGTMLLRRNAAVLGLYMGVAMQARRYLFNLARAITFVITPHFLEQFAQHRSPQRLRESVLRAATGSAFAAPFLALGSAALLPPAVHTLVPKFSAAVSAGKVTSFATCLMIIPLAFSAALVALDREWDSVIAQLAGAAAIAVLAWEPAGHENLLGVAMASAAGTWLASTGVSVAAMRRLGISIGGAVWRVLALQAPLAWSVASFIACDKLAWEYARLADASWGGALLRLCIAWALMLPLAVMAEKRYGMLARVKASLARAAARAGPTENVDQEQP